MFRALPPLVAFVALVTTLCLPESRAVRATSVQVLPIIDMHIHADTLEDFGGGNLAICLGDGKLTLPAIDPKGAFKPQDLVNCEKTIRSASSDGALKSETLAELRKHNVRRAVAMGDLKTVTDWSPPTQAD